jgi:hypothetical protein
MTQSLDKFGSGELEAEFFNLRADRAFHNFAEAFFYFATEEDREEAFGMVSPLLDEFHELLTTTTNEDIEIVDYFCDVMAAAMYNSRTNMRLERIDDDDECICEECAAKREEQR